MNLEFANGWLNRNSVRAKRIEDAVRERALLPVNLDINGIEVKQFCLEHWLILLKIASPFLVAGRVPDPFDVGTFLWIVSPEYDPHSFGNERGIIPWIRRYLATRKRRRFLRMVVRHRPYSLFEPRIRKYLKRAFMDQPASSTGGTPISAGLGASMIHRIAYCYHWSRRDILRLPIAEAFQYLNWIGANQPQFNPVQCAVNARWYVMTAPFQPNAAAATSNASIPTSSHVSPLALMVIPEMEGHCG